MTDTEIVMLALCYQRDDARRSINVMQRLELRYAADPARLSEIATAINAERKILEATSEAIARRGGRQ